MQWLLVGGEDAAQLILSHYWDNGVNEHCANTANNWDSLLVFVEMTTSLVVVENSRIPRR